MDDWTNERTKKVLHRHNICCFDDICCCFSHFICQISWISSYFYRFYPKKIKLLKNIDFKNTLLQKTEMYRNANKQQENLTTNLIKHWMVEWQQFASWFSYIFFCFAQLDSQIKQLRVYLSSSWIVCLPFQEDRGRNKETKQHNPVQLFIHYHNIYITISHRNDTSILNKCDSMCIAYLLLWITRQTIIFFVFALKIRTFVMKCLRFVSVRCWNCFFFFFFFLFFWFALFFFRRVANSRSSLCYVKVFSCCCIRLHMIQFMVFQNRKIATITPMSIHQFNQKRMNWSKEMKTSQLFTVRQMQIFY